MASYDNSKYTYAQVLNGTGYYKQDSNLKYSSGVKTMQTKLNNTGFWCGTPDGKFGADTDAVVRNFQDAYGITVDGAAGKKTLAKLDAVSPSSSNFSKTSGTYGVYFDSKNKCFLHNQQVVYTCLKKAGLTDIVIAGFMGNFETEHGFKTAMSGTGGAVGLVQWSEDRKNNLQKYATALNKDILLIAVQAGFILEECKENGTYADIYAVNCLKNLKNTSIVKTVRNASDYVTAQYERCHYHDSWSDVQNCSSCTTTRHSQSSNDCNGRYYLDTPKRRGYAEAYYACICNM
jgi:hypothetical protein